ncbi:MAG: DUF2271 domain-containing protein [Polyangiales bacterium]
MSRALAFALVLCSCSSANSNDPEFWTPSLTTAGAEDDSSAPATDDGVPVDDTGTVPGEDTGGTTIPAGNCLHVEFTTHSNGGRYSPDHVEAVWIVDGAGKFVRTLALYGFRRTSNLYKWRTAGSNTVDAITSATLTSYTHQQFDWNCNDSSKKHVSPGNYTLMVEFAETDVRTSSQAGPSLSVPFTLGSPTTLMPAAVKGYSDELVKVN